MSTSPKQGGPGRLSPVVAGIATISLVAQATNDAGLAFMYGALAVTSLDQQGNLQPETDGETIQRLRDEILRLTASRYGKP